MISIIVAISDNGVIGRDNSLPWKLSTDLRRFKALTLGKPIIMGRKTWEAIGKPLPQRINIVVTRDSTFYIQNGEVARSIEEAIILARKWAAASAGHEIYIIGGGDIYRQTLSLADRLYVTFVKETVEGDTYFPSIDPTVWQKTLSQDVPVGEKDSHATRYVVYDRRL